MKIIDYRKANTLRIKAKDLPNYKEFIALVSKDKMCQYYNTMQDMVLDAFKWDKTPQGHDYWQGIYDSIELRQQPNCPQCNGIARVWLLKTVNKYKCQKCKITFL
jgi:hypothetical protein